MPRQSKHDASHYLNRYLEDLTLCVHQDPKDFFQNLANIWSGTFHTLRNFLSPSFADKCKLVPNAHSTYMSIKSCKKEKSHLFNINGIGLIRYKYALSVLENKQKQNTSKIELMEAIREFVHKNNFETKTSRDLDSIDHEIRSLKRKKQSMQTQIDYIKTQLKSCLELLEKEKPAVELMVAKDALDKCTNEIERLPIEFSTINKDDVLRRHINSLKGQKGTVTILDYKITVPRIKNSATDLPIAVSKAKAQLQSQYNAKMKDLNNKLTLARKDNEKVKKKYKGKKIESNNLVHRGPDGGWRIEHPLSIVKNDEKKEEKINDFLRAHSPLALEISEQFGNGVIDEMITEFISAFLKSIARFAIKDDCKSSNLKSTAEDNDKMRNEVSAKIFSALIPWINPILKPAGIPPLLPPPNEEIGIETDTSKLEEPCQASEISLLDTIVSSAKLAKDFNPSFSDRQKEDLHMLDDKFATMIAKYKNCLKLKQSESTLLSVTINDLYSRKNDTTESLNTVKTHYTHSICTALEKMKAKKKDKEALLLLESYNETYASRILDIELHKLEIEATDLQVRLELYRQKTNIPSPEATDDSPDSLHSLTNSLYQAKRSKLLNDIASAVIPSVKLFTEITKLKKILQKIITCYDKELGTLDPKETTEHQNEFAEYLKQAQEEYKQYLKLLEAKEKELKEHSTTETQGATMHMVRTRFKHGIAMFEEEEEEEEEEEFTNSIVTATKPSEPNTAMTTQTSDYVEQFRKNNEDWCKLQTPPTADWKDFSIKTSKLSPKSMLLILIEFLKALHQQDNNQAMKKIAINKLQQLLSAVLNIALDKKVDRKLRLKDVLTSSNPAESNIIFIFIKEVIIYLGLGDLTIEQCSDMVEDHEGFANKLEEMVSVLESNMQYFRLSLILSDPEIASTLHSSSKLYHDLERHKAVLVQNERKFNPDTKDDITADTALADIYGKVSQEHKFPPIPEKKEPLEGRETEATQNTPSPKLTLIDRLSTLCATNKELSITSVITSYLTDLILKDTASHASAIPASIKTHAKAKLIISGILQTLIEILKDFFAHPGAKKFIDKIDGLIMNTPSNIASNKKELQTEISKSQKLVKLLQDPTKIGKLKVDLETATTPNSGNTMHLKISQDCGLFQGIVQHTIPLDKPAKDPKIPKKLHRNKEKKHTKTTDTTPKDHKTKNKDAPTTQIAEHSIADTTQTALTTESRRTIQIDEVSYLSLQKAMTEPQEKMTGKLSDANTPSSVNGETQDKEDFSNKEQPAFDPYNYHVPESAAIAVF